MKILNQTKFATKCNTTFLCRIKRSLLCLTSLLLILLCKTHGISKNSFTIYFSCLFFNLTNFLFPLPDYHQAMEVLFSVKIFDVVFSPDLYVLRSSEFKKVVFVNWSVRMCVCDCEVNFQRFIFPKLLKIETPNFIHSTRLVLR